MRDDDDDDADDDDNDDAYVLAFIVGCAFRLNAFLESKK
jgi:hypothetical protein